MPRLPRRLTTGKSIVMRASAQGDKDRNEILRLKKRIKELEKELEERKRR